MNTDYLVRHNTAVSSPRGIEGPIVETYNALVQYSLLHQRRYESPIGEDRIIGQAWLKIASGLLELLNGDCGRLDCGTLDGQIRKLAKANGFSENDCIDVL